MGQEVESLVPKTGKSGTWTISRPQRTEKVKSLDAINFSNEIFA